MNIKFSANELSCLLGDDYDQIYSIMRRSLGANADVFAERVVGYGCLQWHLPGDDWKPMSECSPDMLPAVMARMTDIRQQILSKFGANREMAENVLTTPDDGSVYFRKDSFGQIAVCLAAWGYQRPERVEATDVRSIPTPKGATERVTITIIRDGAAMPRYPFELNGYRRVTSENGSFFVGRVEVGQKFSVAVDGVMNEYVVAPDHGDIRVYLASAAVPVNNPVSDSPVDNPALSGGKESEPVNVPDPVNPAEPANDPVLNPVANPKPVVNPEPPVQPEKPARSSSLNLSEILAIVFFWIMVAAAYYVGLQIIK